MVKENGMVMMTEQEYRNLVGKAHNLECKLDLAYMELATYRGSMKKIAEQNLLGKADEKKSDIEIPARDLITIIEGEFDDAYADDKWFARLDETDLVVSWNGFTSKLMWGPWLFNGLLDAIKECYEEINE